MGTPSRGTGVSPRVVLLSNQIFNIVVDMIICHWFGLVLDKVSGPGTSGYTVSENMTLFYVYYGLIASAIKMWLQWEFYILIVIFVWVRIRAYAE